MQGQRGFWDVEDRLKELSAEGDPLERLSATVDFEALRSGLSNARRRSHHSKGGRPGFDPVLKFKMLVLQALHGLSLTQANYMVRDRLSWMRFCGLGPGDTVPDANTLWDFREALIAAEALDRLFERIDRAITEAGYLPMGDQIIDATLVAVPKQCNTDGEKAAIKASGVPEAWKDKPAKLRPIDRDARWTVKLSKAKQKDDAEPQIDIAIPFYGYIDASPHEVRFHRVSPSGGTTTQSGRTNKLEPPAAAGSCAGRGMWMKRSWERTSRSGFQAIDVCSLSL